MSERDDTAYLLAFVRAAKGQVTNRIALVLVERVEEAERSADNAGIALAQADWLLKKGSAERDRLRERLEAAEADYLFALEALNESLRAAVRETPQP